MNDDEDGRALPLLSLSLVPVVLSPSRCGMRARRRSWERRAAAGARPPAFRSGDRTGTTNERTRERGGESSTRRYPSRKRFRTRICHHKLVLLRVACRQLLILRWPKHSRGSPGPMRAAPTRSQMPLPSVRRVVVVDAYLVSCMARTILSQKYQVTPLSLNTRIPHRRVHLAKN